MRSICLLSPTEFELAKKVPDALVSSLPEQKGVDVLIYDDTGFLGIQRKTYPKDLIASVQDGRLQREIPLMLEHLDFGIVMLEGRPRFTEDGVLFDEWNSRWTRKQLRNLYRSCMYMGIPVDRTENIDDTVDAIEEWRQWWEKGEHETLTRLPKKKDSWGKYDPSSILQAADKIGPKVAKKIYSHFGRVPLRWDCTIEELMQIDGIGKVSGTKLWNLFATEQVEMPVKKRRNGAKT